MSPEVLFDQVEEKLSEVRFFLAAMKQADSRHAQYREALRRPFDEQGKPISLMFRYFFSGYLSAHRAVRYYMIRISKRIRDTADWRQSIDNRLVLSALRHLRDTDIHDETMNMRVTVQIKTQPAPEINVSGLHLHRVGLARNRRIAEKPGVLEYLTSKSVIEIAVEGLSELEAAVADGKARGFLPPQPLGF